MNERTYFGGVFHVECYDKHGALKWEDDAPNLVVNEGLQHILDVVFSGGTAKDPWYVGLIGDTTTVNATDTQDSHSGWTELTAYTGNRQEWVEVRSSQSMTNSASKASFTLNADSQTIGGAFLVAAASGDEVLMSAAAFTGGDKSGDSSDVLEVTYTFSAADDGA